MRQMFFRIATLAILTLLTAPHATARDAFVTALLPCLELLQKPDSDPRYQIVLDRGWTATLFNIAEKDGGGLGTDLCGELSGGGMEFAGTYSWPESLGKPIAVSQSMVTPAWLDQIIRNARAKNASGAPVQRISITALTEPNAHLVRVEFANAEADPNAVASVDLNSAGVVITHDSRVPDQFPLKAESDQTPPTVVEAIAAPSVDPRQALALLIAGSQAKPDATVVRVTLSSFSAGLVYRNAANGPIRQTEFNYIEAQADTVTDELFEFPAAFKTCAMTLPQVNNAVAKVALQKRYQAIAKRLQHLILECSEAKPKPHWSLVALEPFEYFDLPAEL